MMEIDMYEKMKWSELGCLSSEVYSVRADQGINHNNANNTPTISVLIKISVNLYKKN